MKARLGDLRRVRPLPDLRASIPAAWRMNRFFIIPHTHPNGFLQGSPMLMDPHLSKQHAGLQHPVLRLQQEVTRPELTCSLTTPHSIQSGSSGVTLNRIKMGYPFLRMIFPLDGSNTFYLSCFCT